MTDPTPPYTDEIKRRKYALAESIEAALSQFTQETHIGVRSLSLEPLRDIGDTHASRYLLFIDLDI